MTTNEQERKWRIESSMDLMIFPDDKKIIIKLMAKWGLSRRTAREYLEVMKEINGR